jgi:FMN phosphatase YigB (HAD superfamily)
MKNNDVDMEYEKQKARGFALTAFKTKKEYKKMGFRNNAEDMLDLLNEKFDRLHLITAGVPVIQNPKIEALNLEQWFDEIHIVEIKGKKDKIQKLRNKYDATNITHIGNSEMSDIKAAIKADANAVYLPRSQWMGTTDTDYNKIDSVEIFDSIPEYITHIQEN